MKKQRILNLLLLTSISLFTACSSKTPKVTKVDKKLSAYNIIGLSKGEIASVSIKSAPKKIIEIPLAKTYPITTTYPMAVESYANNDYSNNYYSMNSNSISSIHTEFYEDTPIMENQVVYPEVISKKKAPTSYRKSPVHGSHVKHQIEADAKRLLGIKYVWGATGPNKYDCSGFTQKVFRDAGINIPRVSRDQAKVGQYVSYNNLIKGDMVFFDTHKKRTGKVTHVGIYLGNGNFIHASSGAKKIVIFNFNNKKFYKKRFLWGRRVIRDNNFRIASR